jgi:hypothetical protein
VKDEEVYLKSCGTLAKAKRELAIYFLIIIIRGGNTRNMTTGRQMSLTGSHYLI